MRYKDNVWLWLQDLAFVVVVAVAIAIFVAFTVGISGCSHLSDVDLPDLGDVISDANPITPEPEWNYPDLPEREYGQTGRIIEVKEPTNDRWFTLAESGLAYPIDDFSQKVPLIVDQLVNHWKLIHGETPPDGVRLLGITTQVHGWMHNGDAWDTGVVTARWQDTGEPCSAPNVVCYEADFTHGFALREYLYSHHKDCVTGSLHYRFGVGDKWIDLGGNHNMPPIPIRATRYEDGSYQTHSGRYLYNYETGGVDRIGN